MCNTPEPNASLTSPVAADTDRYVHSCRNDTTPFHSVIDLLFTRGREGGEGGGGGREDGGGKEAELRKGIFTTIFFSLPPISTPASFFPERLEPQSKPNTT